MAMSTNSSIYRSRDQWQLVARASRDVHLEEVPYPWCGDESNSIGRNDLVLVRNAGYSNQTRDYL